jgi:hypothetical protein
MIVKKEGSKKGLYRWDTALYVEGLFYCGYFFPAFSLLSSASYFAKAAL